MTAKSPNARSGRVSGPPDKDGTVGTLRDARSAETRSRPPAPYDEEPADLEDSGPRRRDRWYTTGEMARLSDNTLRTVRFYEEAGIIRPVGRTEGGHRLFERAELDRLLLVSDL